MTGDERYAQAAVRLIDGWVNTVQSTSREEDSTLSFSYHFPAMIFGADLLASWPGFSADRQDAFRRFCRQTALPLNTMDRSNNWGNWGLVLVLACAKYLDDDELLDRGEQRWKELLDRQIDDQRAPAPRSPARWRQAGYLVLALLTFSADDRGRDPAGRRAGTCYDWRSPDGHTLRQAFEPLAGWTRDPASFPYWDGDPKPANRGDLLQLLRDPECTLAQRGCGGAATPVPAHDGPPQCPGADLHPRRPAEGPGRSPLSANHVGRFAALPAF